MAYLGEIFWYISLPITIWISVKFVQHNLQHFNKLERLEIYEKNDQTLQQKEKNETSQ